VPSIKRLAIIFNLKDSRRPVLLQPAISAAHVIQPAILCRDIDATMDRLHAMFGIYPSERVDIRDTGVNNAVYALGGFSFLELIEPYETGSAAYRLLERFGEGFHMTAVDLEPQEPAQVDAALEAANVRVVRRNQTTKIRGAWHLHPKDTHGVLIALAIKADPDDNGAWAGPAWREYVSTNSRVLSRVLGVSVACESLEAAVARYGNLGFSFGSRFEHYGDTVVQAVTPRGTLLQLRMPAHTHSLAGGQLARRGEGLCHLLLEAHSLPAVRSRLEAAGAQVDREGSNADGLWTVGESTWGIPFEIRQKIQS
jgi:hypothetical protein